MAILPFGNMAMPPALQVVLLFPVLLSLGLVALLALEVAAACPRPKARAGKPDDAPDGPVSLAVLVPAHDEAAGIAETILALRPQLPPGARLLVVADNCSDDTAALARQAGAEVVERFDPARRGKGYALDFGVRHLQADPPAVVLVVDADCRLAEGAVVRLADAAARDGAPAQGCYLMRAPEGAGLGMRVAELAFLVKNRVRPAGLARLGLPCHLTGTGMAFPWALIRDANLAHASLVEDMRLGLDMTLAGAGPRFCEAALVTSDFPLSQAGAATQRSRWEEGHLGMIGLALGHAARAVRAGRFSAALLALDVMIPPLTLLILVVSALFLVTLGVRLALGPAPVPLAIATVALVLLFGALAVAWWRFGRAVLPPRLLLHVPLYIGAKFAFYLRMARGARSAGWIRTDRSR